MSRNKVLAFIDRDCYLELEVLPAECAELELPGYQSLEKGLWVWEGNFETAQGRWRDLLQEEWERLQRHETVLREEIVSRGWDDIFGQLGGERAEGKPVSACLPVTQSSRPTLYDVHLEFLGPNKINVIKEIRSFSKTGLKEAKDLAESAPRIVGAGMTHAQASEFVDALKKAAAQAIIFPSKITAESKKFGVRLRGYDSCQQNRIINTFLDNAPKEIWSAIQARVIGSAHYPQIILDCLTHQQAQEIIEEIEREGGVAEIFTML